MQKGKGSGRRRGTVGRGSLRGRGGARRPAAQKEARKQPTAPKKQKTAGQIVDQDYIPDVPVVLGFVRGAAPEKWAGRWQQRHPNAPLTLEALDERPLRSAVGIEILEAGGMLLVRAGASDTADTLNEQAVTAGIGEIHAVRLYVEGVAVLAEKDADITASKTVDLETLEILEFMQHPEHDATWPAATPWADPAWEPATASACADIVATGAGIMLAPLPLARHISDRKTHAVIPVSEDCDLPGTQIFAVWAKKHNSNTMQELLGIMRGRTANSSR